MTEITNQLILKASIGGKLIASTCTDYFDVFDPNTGEVQALAPKCTHKEVVKAIETAHEAYQTWSNVSVFNRVQILYKFRELIEIHLDELITTLCKENGKTWHESKGDVMKAKEVVEFACNTPTLMMGESLMNVSAGYDTVSYRESIGVFTGIVPFNFPAMIPMGWIIPLCIATGNTVVLKASNITPMTSFRMVELLYEAGLPAGVVNILTCDNAEAAPLLEHPYVKGVTFVGSTNTGKYIYQKAAAHGKRVQALCQAKNHALVMEDADLEKVVHATINAAYGCAGERCMALSVLVVQETIADRLVAYLKQQLINLKIGPGYLKESQLGAIITEAHLVKIKDWIKRGIEEGAELVLDGRGYSIPGYEQGFYLGPTIFDHVKAGMQIGEEEIFGPVLCIKRVRDFEEGLALMNANPFANGSIIFTESGYYSREFMKRTDAGMVGVNVGIPVPVSVFPFTGHKNSFFGDLHTLGKDGVKFYTESKVVTTHWFNPTQKGQSVDTWGRTV